MHFLAMKFRIRPDLGCIPLRFYFGSKRSQHQFGMISRQCRFCNGNRTISVKTGQKYAGLDLRRSHRRIIMDGFKRMPLNRQRRTSVVQITFNICSHHGQWFDNAPHRSFLNGSVTGKMAGKRLSCQYAGDQTCCRTTVAGIQCFCRRSQPMQTFTVNVEHIILFFYLNAHFPKTGDGGQTVRTL